MMYPAFILALLALSGAHASPAPAPASGDPPALKLHAAAVVQLNLTAALTNAGIQVGALLSTNAGLGLGINKRDALADPVAMPGADTAVRSDPTIKMLTNKLAAQADMAAGAVEHKQYISDDAEESLDVTALVEGLLRAGVGAGVCGPTSSSSSKKEKNYSPRAAEPQRAGAALGAEVNAAAALKAFLAGLMVGADAKVDLVFGSGSG